MRSDELKAFIIFLAMIGLAGCAAAFKVGYSWGYSDAKAEVKDARN